MSPDGTDWWTAFYPPDNFQRPTGPLCDGCHSVNYNIETKTVTEWNVGCERCHGAGSEHVAQKTRTTSSIRRAWTMSGPTTPASSAIRRGSRRPIRSRANITIGRSAITSGCNLADFWKLEEHKLGETTFTHFADGTAHKNRMQGNDFVQSLMYKRGVTCFSCHDPHGTENESMLRKPDQ